MAKEPLKILTESMFYVLLSLLRQERCGTEIVQFVDDTTAGRVPLALGRCIPFWENFRRRASSGRRRWRAASGPTPSQTGAAPCSARSFPD